MSREDDYLWDRSGKPDPDVEELENLLSPMAAGDKPMRELPKRATYPMSGYIVAAAVILAAVVTYWVAQTTRHPPEPAPRPTVQAQAATLDALTESAWIEASDADKTLAMGDLGELRLDKGARLQLRRRADHVTRFFLERGTLHAVISAKAKPRFFQVDTPTGRIIDLGCKYTLSVREDGSARVHVQDGQVAFDDMGREVLVPAGAVCEADRTAGIGTPYFLGSAPGLIEALADFDKAKTAPAEHRQVLARKVLDAAGSPRETLSVYHLLRDADVQVSTMAGARLEALVTRPQDLSESWGMGCTSEDGSRWKRHLAQHWH